jgi:hypothetical protein
MDRVWLRLTVAILFVLVWSVPFYLDAANPDTSSGSGDVGGLAAAAFLVVYGGLTLFTGFLVRWPALVLPVVIYFVLVPLGVDPEDSDGWTYAALYAIPGSFFVFLVLLGGGVGRLGVDYWRSRRGAEAQRTDARGAESRKLLLIPLGLLLVAGALLLVLDLTSRSTEVKTAKVAIMKGTPPEPGAGVLQLTASVDDSCGSGDDRVIDPRTEETATQVTVRASYEVQRKFPCETGRAERIFVTPLRHALGGRVVVDGSRGVVIWPRRR